MFRDCTRSPHDHLLLLQALMMGVRKRGSGINEEAHNERAKFRRAAVAVSENLPDLRKVAACFECCTKTLRRWISKRAAGEPMGNAGPFVTGPLLCWRQSLYIRYRTRTQKLLRCREYLDAVFKGFSTSRTSPSYSLHIMHDRHTLLTSCKFEQAHARCIACSVCCNGLNTDCLQTTVHTCLHSTASTHMPQVTSKFFSPVVWTTCSLRASDTTFYFV